MSKKVTRRNLIRRISATSLTLALISTSVTDAFAAEERVVPVTEDGYAINSPEFARLYGPGVYTMTNLANVRSGVVGDNRKENIPVNRFRATHSGTLETLKLYWPTGPGYSVGTAGKIKVSVVPDDGSDQHLPNLDAEPLAVAFFEPKLTHSEKQKASFLDPLTVEPGAKPLENGKIYHVVQQNVDPNPQENYVSSDHAAVNMKNGKPARWLNDTDWSTLMGVRDPGAPNSEIQWINLTSEGSQGKFFIPIMDLGYSDGHHQGSFDMESGAVVGEKERTYDITAGAPVREHFTPSEEKRVSGVSFATVATVGGSLTWSLKEGDTVLATGKVNQPQPNFDPDEMGGNNIANFQWYDAELPKDVVLAAGKEYDLELAAEDGSQWKIAAHANGARWNVSWPVAFTESQSQRFANGKWVNASNQGHAEATGTNFPVVLHLAP